MVYSRFSSCVFCFFSLSFFFFFNLRSRFSLRFSRRKTAIDLQTYRNTASRGADGRSEGNTRARINWILRNQSSSFVSRRLIKIGRKDDVHLCDHLREKSKNTKEKRIYIYIVGSMQLPGASIVEILRKKPAKKTLNKREQNIKKDYQRVSKVCILANKI